MMNLGELHLCTNFRMSSTQMIFSIVTLIISSLIGLFGVAAGLCGYLYKRIPMLLRIIMIVGGIAMMVPGTLTDVIGLVALLVIVLFQKRGVETAAA